MKGPGLMLLTVGALLAGSMLIMACGGEDRPSVDVIDGTGGASSSSSASSSASGTGSGSATGEAVGPGVVEEKPADAAQVDVTLREWEVAPAQNTVAAGQVYFLVENAGPEDPHEFVVIRTDEDPGALTVVDGRVPEDQVDIVGEIEPFTPGSSASITLDLEPGKYVFICNIAEVEDGELESHYGLGMRTAFTVE